MRHSLLLLLFSLLGLANITLAQNNPVLRPGAPNQNADWQLSIYTDALMNVYYEKPNIYKIHNRIINGPATPSFYMNMYTLPYLKTAYRFAEGPAGAALTWAAEDNEQTNDMNTYHLMANNPDEVRRTAQKMALEMTRSNSARSREIHDVYEQTHQFEGSNKLPYSDNLEYLKQHYPGAAEKYNPENLAKEKQKLDQLKKNKPEEYNKYVQKKYVNLPEKMEVKKLTTKQQREKEMMEYRKNFTEIQMNFQAGVEILSIIDPKMGRSVSVTGAAAFKIYDAGHTMLNQGFLDLKNLGNIANGIGLFMSLFSEDATAKALQQILENQKKILDKLADLEMRTERLQVSMNYLIQLTTYQQARIENEINEIKRRLESIATDIYSSADFTQYLAQEQRIIDYTIEKEGLIKRFWHDQGTNAWEHKISLFTGPYRYLQMSTDEKIYFSNVNDILNKINIFATQILDDPNYRTFNDVSNIAQLSAAQIASKRTKDINQRMAMLPSIGHWLHSHIGNNPNLLQFEVEKSDNADGLELNTQISNPKIFSFLLREYLELASYRPLSYKRDGSVLFDINMQSFCEEYQKTTNAFQAMRDNVPLAAGVLNFHLQRLKRIHDTGVHISSVAQNLALQENGLPATANSPLVLYGGLTEQQIRNKLSSLPEELFVDIAVKTGAFVTQSRGGGEEIYKTVDVGNAKNENYRQIVMEKGDKTIHFLIPTVTLTVSNKDLPQIYDFRAHYHYFGRNDKFGSLLDRGQKDIFIATADTRRPFVDALTGEIVKRHQSISTGWRDELNKAEVPYLNDIYRARFILETLLLGGYGAAYENITETDSVSRMLNEANKIISFIESNWKNGLNVIEPSQTDTMATPFVNYFLRHARYIENNDSAKTFRSVIKDYKIPRQLKSPFYLPIGDFAEAEKALEWAYQFEDLKTECTKGTAVRKDPMKVK